MGSNEQIDDTKSRNKLPKKSIVDKSWEKMKEDNKIGSLDEENKEIKSETELKPSNSVSKQSRPITPSVGYQIDYSHLPELQKAERGYVEGEYSRSSL